MGSTGGDIANIINIFLQTIININCVAISQIGCKFTNFDILCFMIIQEQQNFYTQDISKFPEECLFSECWIDSKEKTFCNISPSASHFLKNVTLSCPTGGMLPQAACYWLTK